MSFDSDMARLHAYASALTDGAKTLMDRHGSSRIELEDIAERARSLQAAVYTLWVHARDRNNQLGIR